MSVQIGAKIFNTIIAYVNTQRSATFSEINVEAL